MRELSLPAGARVLCGNGHLVATINRNLYRGDVNYSSAFDFTEGQSIPVKGQMLPLLCYCGAAWFDNLKCVKIE